MICLDEGDLDKALSLVQEALSLRQQQLPSGHPDVAQALLGVAEVLMAQEQYEEAEHRLTAAVQVGSCLRLHVALMHLKKLARWDRALLGAFLSSKQACMVSILQKNPRFSEFLCRSLSRLGKAIELAVRIDE
jgi:tetratricopeptide (TPR) repeat protein